MAMMRAETVKTWARERLRTRSTRPIRFAFIDPGVATGVVLAEWDHGQRIVSISALTCGVRERAAAHKLVFSFDPELVIAEKMPTNPVDRASTERVSWDSTVVHQLVGSPLPTELVPVLWIMPASWKPWASMMGYPHSLNRISNMFAMSIRWRDWKPEGQGTLVGIQSVGQHQKDALGMGLWFLCQFFCDPTWGKVQGEDSAGR